MKNLEGNKVPQITFKTRTASDWKKITSDDVFSGKTVAVFSLPGAFTPTCSSAHVPRYNELYGVFKENGVDEIVCVSVNDAFVMNAWKEDQKAQNITFLPDGNGEFTKAMEMLVSKNDLGFGDRSWRYSMIVKDGIIEKMFIEPEKEGDPYEVSDADTMLEYINPNAKKPEFATIFTKEGCTFCAKAKKLLEDKKISYEEIPLSKTITSKTLRAVSNKSTVPQVFIGGKYIGGADDLEKYFA